MKTLKNTDIAVLSPSDVLLLNRTELAVCVYVGKNEAPVFWQYVLPLARSMRESDAVDVRVISLDCPFMEQPARDVVSILALDAGNLSLAELKSLLRLESSDCVNALIRDLDQRIVFYLHNIHAAKEKLAPVMTDFAEAYFGGPDERIPRDASNTRIVISGIHKMEMAGKVMRPAVTNRCAVCGFDC